MPTTKVSVLNLRDKNSQEKLFIRNTCLPAGRRIITLPNGVMQAGNLRITKSVIIV